jgi:hypothetical protein
MGLAHESLVSVMLPTTQTDPRRAFRMSALEWAL